MTQTASSLQEATKAVNDRFLAAIARKDARAMAEIYTTDGEVMPTGSPEIRGHEAISGFWQAVLDMGIARAEMTSREVSGAGDAAYEVGQFRLYDANDQQLDHGKFIVIWRQENGEWRWHRDIFNSSQTPQ